MEVRECKRCYQTFRPRLEKQGVCVNCFAECILAFLTEDDDDDTLKETPGGNGVLCNEGRAANNED